MNTRTWLVTGGAGFIGSNFILSQFNPQAAMINVDKLTYAGNPHNLNSLTNEPNYILVQSDIGNEPVIEALLHKYQPEAVINFAAETHVDRSIYNPQAFIQTNIVGAFHLLQTVRNYWRALKSPARESFRFLHVSTDEVYGSLEPDAPPFTETSPCAPNSPYSASKAGGDHLVRSYHRTYGLPAIITRSSNNYGPRQFPEKLIPLVILNSLQGKALPIYGDGNHLRDWLYVEDHCEAMRLVLEAGRIGETYNIGSGGEQTNLEVVRTICALLDELCPQSPQSPQSPHASLITFVKDRPGHDRRYALDCTKIARELGWKPKESLSSGLIKTIRWYLDHQDWVSSIQTGAYREWVRQHYGEI
ncbi:MAG: dTDP-glucose 4,6-dehydratase [Deltaproteobacteria bacterium]|nr:dTDP-glucose 4,6-dehydratase [Deltaproteobacteria bacterium]